MSQRSMFVLGVSFFVLASTASAAGDRVSAVSVKSTGSALTVRVTGPTTLRAVLEALCEQAEARCELEPGAAEVPAQAAEITGGWSQVLDALLKDSGISYASTPPAAGRAAYLSVEGPASARPTNTASEPDRAPGPVGAPVPEVVVPEPEPTEPPPADPSEGSATSDAAAASPYSSPNSSIVTAETASAAAASGSTFAVTPFSDAQGRPLLARTNKNEAANAASGAAPGWTVLPFADASGNPMVVQVTNPPLDVTPFAGPDGEPWPAPPPQPGHKPGSPFPPATPPTPPKAEDQ